MIDVEATMKANGIHYKKLANGSYICHDGDIYSFIVDWHRGHEGYRWMCNVAHVDAILRRVQA